LAIAGILTNEHVLLEGLANPLLSFDLARRRIGCCVDCRPMVALTLDVAILIDCHFQRSAGKIATGASNRAHILDRSGRGG
jgi:hypothetical protein